MITESNLKTTLTILLLISLCIYLLIAEVPLLLGMLRYTSNNIILLLKIGGLLVSLFTIFTSMKSKWLAKILLGKRYIAGKYTGKSYWGNEEVEHIEEF